MLHSVWYVLHGVWYVLYGVWCVLYGVCRVLVFSVLSETPGTSAASSKIERSRSEASTTLSRTQDSLSNLQLVKLEMI